MIDVHLSSFAYNRLKSCRWITYPQSTCKRLWALKSVNNIMYLFIRMQVIIYPCVYAGYHISMQVITYIPCTLHTYLSMQVIIYPPAYLHTYLFVQVIIYPCAQVQVIIYPCACIWLSPCSPAITLLSMFHVKHFRLFPCIPIYPCRLLLSMCVLLYNLIIIRARKIGCYFP